MTTAFTIRPRPPQARKMDRLYRRQRHVYDATRKYYLLGRDRLIAGLDIPDGGRVLEIGCGTGRNLVLAARRNPQGLFYGIDISRQMLLSAEAAARRGGVSERVFTAPGDAETHDAAAGFALAGFERIFFSYCLSMIPGWRAALQTAMGQLAPGGSLHIVDFGQMDSWPRLARTALHAWLDRFHVTPRGELAETARQLAADGRLAADIRQIAGGYGLLIRLCPRDRASAGLPRQR